MNFDDYYGEQTIDEDTKESFTSNVGEYDYELKNNDVVYSYINDLVNGSSKNFNQNSIVTDIDDVAMHIKKMLNIAWGDTWGEFHPSFTDCSQEGSVNNLVLPQITYDYTTRVIPKKVSRKPQLYDTIKEVVNGKPTGDAFKIYRQWFDYIVEFNFWHEDVLKARKLMKQFEALFNTCVPFLKEHGVSVVYFLEETDAINSSKYREDIPMRCTKYFFRIENISIVRVNTLHSISLEVDMQQ